MLGTEDLTVYLIRSDYLTTHIKDVRNRPVPSNMEAVSAFFMGRGADNGCTERFATRTSGKWHSQSSIFIRSIIFATIRRLPARWANNRNPRIRRCRWPFMSFLCLECRTLASRSVGRSAKLIGIIGFWLIYGAGCHPLSWGL